MFVDNRNDFTLVVYYLLLLYSGIFFIYFKEIVCVYKKVKYYRARDIKYFFLITGFLWTPEAFPGPNLRC